MIQNKNEWRERGKTRRGKRKGKDDLRSLLRSSTLNLKPKLLADNLVIPEEFLNPWEQKLCGRPATDKCHLSHCFVRNPVLGWAGGLRPSATIDLIGSSLGFQLLRKLTEFKAPKVDALVSASVTKNRTLARGSSCLIYCTHWLQNTVLSQTAPASRVPAMKTWPLVQIKN